MVKEIKAAWGKGTEVSLYFPKDDEWFEEFTTYLIAVTEQQIDEEHIQSKFEIYILYIAARMKMDRYEAAEFLLEIMQEYNNINLVIAENFARIFRQNMFNCGMMAISLSHFVFA